MYLILIICNISVKTLSLVFSIQHKNRSTEHIFENRKKPEIGTLHHYVCRDAKIIPSIEKIKGVPSFTVTLCYPSLFVFFVVANKYPYI
ncbi:hypothetical protein WN51_01080 [Melipona quadrifasciata]|uniref:Uncharacterized protein n=1 Tax=Melipona quadrifasciata TaxID=166423 RepID=A0A0N0BEQ1_9HYME|nr:hypothetical protein WN51_01080 [Melipona quadrifasciata]